MLYVPDARGYTIEIIEGSAKKRMVENLRRWSGNMLRNGQRAIMLGPAAHAVLHLVVLRRSAPRDVDDAVLAAAGDGRRDEARHSVSSSPISSSLHSRAACWRLILSVYAHRVDLNFVWALYANQLVNAAVKVYMIWRLSKQKWTNRGNQKAGFAGSGMVAIAAQRDGDVADARFRRRRCS